MILQNLLNPEHYQKTSVHPKIIRYHDIIQKSSRKSSENLPRVVNNHPKIIQTHWSQPPFSTHTRPYLAPWQQVARDTVAGRGSGARGTSGFSKHWLYFLGI
jgi:hypothetical protein